MAFSKVILNGTTLMDVTQKTVTANTMLSGITALKNDGTDISGSIASQASVTIMPTTSQQVAVTAGKYTTGDVIVAAIPSNCIIPYSGDAGTIVTVNGTVDVPLIELVVYGKSTQAGTPAPDAPADIATAGSGGTLPMVSAGKNLIDSGGLDGYTKNGLTCTVSNGAVTISGNAPSAVTLLYASRQSLPAGTYIISGGVSSDISVALRDDSGTQISGTASTGSETTFTLTKTRNDIWPCIRVAANASVSGQVIRLMVRPASVSDSAFAAYNSVAASIDTTPNGLPGIPVTSGGNYTDSSGQQWLCDTIDLEAGVWVKRCGVLTLDGSRTYTLGSGGAFYTEVDDLIHATDYQGKMLCDRLTVVDRNGTVASTVNSISGYRDDPNAYPNRNWIYFHIENISTAADLATWLGTHPIKVVYALTTPVSSALTSEQLTALRSLRGRKGLTNLYSADPAEPEISAEMYIDIQTYIDSIINRE